MEELSRKIYEFVNRYNIFPNKIILGKDIVHKIMCEYLGYEIICTYEDLKVLGIDTEVDHKHPDRMSIMLELK